MFHVQVDELGRATDGTVNAIDEIVQELDAIKEVLHRSTADGSLYEIANSIRQRAIMQRDRLAGNQMRDMYHEWDEVSVSARLWHAGFDAGSNAYGPTPEQRESLAIAQEQYETIRRELSELIDVEYAGLKVALDAAGVPWSPGRGVQ